MAIRVLLLLLYPFVRRERHFLEDLTCCVKARWLLKPPREQYMQLYSVGAMSVAFAHKLWGKKQIVGNVARNWGVVTLLTEFKLMGVGLQFSFPPC